jgi:hypothetical protein
MDYHVYIIFVMIIFPFFNFKGTCEVFNFIDGHGGPMEMAHLEK